uniref:R-spondin Fu-CRD domain-containing protein n=1 Tax=Oreochromis niloticus TaxID=8128 RepID=A0A669C1V4_ORENI
MLLTKLNFKNQTDYVASYWSAGCKPDCASCFSENFCLRCHPGNFLFGGKCEPACPKGLTVMASDLFFHHGHCHLTCPQGFEPDVQLMWCTPQTHCEVGEWTHWGACRTRTRPVLHFPSVYGNPCSHLSEIRKCAIRKRLRSSLSKWQRRNKMFNAYKRYTSSVDSLNTSRFSTH